MNRRNKKVVPFINPVDFEPAANVADTRLILTTPPITSVLIPLDPKRIAFMFGILALALVLASSAAQFIDYSTGYSSVLIHKAVKLLNVDLELNLPAFYSASLLLFSALILAIIAYSKHKEKDQYRLHWATLACGFLFMSFDETIAAHERLIEPVRTLLGEVNLGIWYFAWVVPAIFLLIILGAFFLKFLINLPPNTRQWFLIAATVYLGAAVGLELIEGLHVEVFGKENLTYIALATTEESLEMAGIIVFINALLTYMAGKWSSVQFRIVDSTGSGH